MNLAELPAGSPCARLVQQANPTKAAPPFVSNVGRPMRSRVGIAALFCVISISWAQGAIAATPGSRDTRAVVADVDCDGKPDRIVLRQDSKEVRVDVTFGALRRRSAAFTFVVSSGTEAGVCSIPVHLEIESLDYDPTEAVGPVEGFARSTTCKGFVLDDDRCDPVHFFWNRKTKRLAWWRA